jgi:phosphoribosylformylglycinamidine cyclo-ligase
MPRSYEEAGVSIDGGDKFAEYIAKHSSKAIGEIGGFAGGFELDTEKYKKPVILSSTDGVGTKLLVAQAMEKFDTVGIDLVAMCVNDLAVTGAETVSFLDYIGCGKLNNEILQAVVEGIIQGCELAGCTLSGGETAEMPDMYQGNDFDLAGFAIGVAEKSEMLPKKSEMKSGDLIYGLPSVGIHSNGLSLARKLILNDHPLYSELLRPTKIYTKELETLIQSAAILGAAHITGGGLEGNLIRSIPEDLKMDLSWDWKVPEIFKAIQKEGPVEESEMRKTFNMGIGIAIIVQKEKEQDFLQAAESIDHIKIGSLK